VTSGTFLRGVLHFGEKHGRGGRRGEPPVEALSHALRALGLRTGRFKTGTPPRLDGRTLDLSRTERQDGDADPRPFSFDTPRPYRPRQLPCWLTSTTPATHDLIRASLHRSPIYGSARIQGTGPRYCPSVEDKVVRFASRDSHQVFLEPEGRDSHEVYLGGVSTSLPPDVQEELVRTIPGCEHARILRYGYAVEYDYVPPDQIHPSLETKVVEGLFLAGQINGTSGYEEAAAQGILAGINAAQLAAARAPVVLGRDQAMIGVLVDDLVTRGTEEPYRMFTSRAEHRLTLRHDNADRRLRPLALRLGLVTASQHRRLEAKEGAISTLTRLLQSRGAADGRSLAQHLRRPEVTLAGLAAEHGFLDLLADAEVAEQVEIEVKYEGYLRIAADRMERTRRDEETPIPDGFDYAALVPLRNEARSKLHTIRPRTLGQAGRIPGITPADVQLLAIFVARARRGA
jgi:tRNA uridine 5-carboxymethylaminomethyl modification enzyme